jgi:fructose-1-phosphate kinase PfkB-like protein
MSNTEEKLDPDKLVMAMKVVLDAREQQLASLAQRKDFPPFVMKEIKEELKAVQEEKATSKKENGKKENGEEKDQHK